MKQHRRNVLTRLIPTICCVKGALVTAQTCASGQFLAKIVQVLAESEVQQATSAHNTNVSNVSPAAVSKQVLAQLEFCSWLDPIDDEGQSTHLAWRIFPQFLMYTSAWAICFVVSAASEQSSLMSANRNVTKADASVAFFGNTAAFVRWKVWRIRCKLHTLYVL